MFEYLFGGIVKCNNFPLFKLQSFDFDFLLSVILLRPRLITLADEKHLQLSDYRFCKILYLLSLIYA